MNDRFADRITEQDAERPGYAAAWSRWRERLLAVGGSDVVPPSSPDPMLDEFVAHAGEIEAADVVLRESDWSDCHRNAVGLWRQGDAIAVGTGYALSDDGLWREHSWAFAPAGRLIETTVERTAYVGLRLDGAEAERFGELVAPLADPKSHMVKVRFSLDQDEDGWPPATNEGLWAEPVGGDHYRLTNTPWFVHGVAWGDVVEAERADGALWATRRITEGGHGTIRIIPFRAGALGGSTAAALDLFRPLGASGESVEHYGILALDVPPEADIAAIRDLLAAGFDDGRWDYEEACLPEGWDTA